MKRKFTVLLAAALLTAGLAGCGGEKESTAESYIAPVSFAAEERELLALLGVEENRFFEYQLGEDIESMEFRIYRLTEGEWTLVDEGGMSGFLDDTRSGRLAVLFDRIPGGVEIAAKGVRFASGELEEVPAGAAVGLVTLGEKKAIDGEAEIPLALQIFSGNAIGSHGVEAFDHPEELAQENYSGVYAITVAFGGEA